MSATGEFDNDDTHAPIPQDRFADPLAGLVTTSDAAPSVSEEFERLRIADPVQPDPDTVREMVNATMLAENADYDRLGQPAAIQPQANGSSTAAGQPPLGIIPQQRTWPARPPQLLRQARWPRPRRAGKNAEDAPRPKRKAARNRIPLGKPSSNSAGVILAVVLMIVFVVLFIQLLASLFSGIAGIFS